MKSLSKSGLLVSLFWVFMTNSSQGQSIADLIAKYQYPVKYLEVNDSLKLAYVDEGTGNQTLILIHGLATYIPSWYPVIDSLRDQYRVIAIDLPGYGRSSDNGAKVTIRNYADAVLALVKALSPNRPVLVGHSMGGQVAVRAALSDPDTFEKLVLLAPAGFETFEAQHATWLKSVFTPQAVFYATEPQIRANWALNFHTQPADVEFMIQDRLNMTKATNFMAYGENLSKSVMAMLDEPIFNELNALKPRTLVIYGENDALIPNKYLHPQTNTTMIAESGTQEIPGAVLKMVPECGHFISYDYPAVSQMIAEFVN